MKTSQFLVLFTIFRKGTEKGNFRFITWLLCKFCCNFSVNIDLAH